MGRFSFEILKPLLHSIRATKPLLPIIKILHRRRTDDARSYLFCVRCSSSSSSRANSDLTAHNGKPNDCTSCEQTLGIFVSTLLTYIFACFFFFASLSYFFFFRCHVEWGTLCVFFCVLDSGILERRTRRHTETYPTPLIWHKWWVKGIIIL